MRARLLLLSMLAVCSAGPVIGQDTSDESNSPLKKS